MVDILALRGLRVLCYCGALPEEQLRRQPFSIDADLHVDTRAAGVSDDLDDTVDYGAITAAIAETAEGERFTLMERLAERLGEVVLADARVERTSITVTKLRPPVPEDLATAGVTITRTRDR